MSVSRLLKVFIGLLFSVMGSIVFLGYF